MGIQRSVQKQAAQKFPSMPVKASRTRKVGATPPAIGPFKNKTIGQIDKETHFPPEIFGKLPPSGTLDLPRQHVQMLLHWLRKTNCLLKKGMNGKDITENHIKYGIIQSRLHQAILEARPNHSRDVALKLLALFEICDIHDLSPGSVMDRADLAAMAADLIKLTEPPHPTKRIGRLTKGCKLTRSGKLVRYHAFLIGELRTLGWAFYGQRDFPVNIIPCDTAVSKRCRPLTKGRGIFFDEPTLLKRAETVLRSLKINTTDVE